MFKGDILAKNWELLLKWFSGDYPLLVYTPGRASVRDGTWNHQSTIQLKIAYPEYCYLNIRKNSLVDFGENSTEFQGHEFKNK